MTMRPRAGLRLVLAAVAGAAAPLRSRALFGVGDIVFDPANVTQTINVLRQAQQQVDRLGSLLGVSTRQYDQLVQLAVAAGDAAKSAGTALPATGDELATLVRSIPGLAGADAAGLLNSAGQLDAFMGLSFSDWVAAVEHPLDFYRQLLVGPAIERAGATAGASGPTLAYAQWYGQSSDEDRYNGATRAASDLAGLMASDWLESARQRRVNLQLLAAGGTAAETTAAAARTQADQQSAQAQLTAATNRILVESAAQGAGAAEAQVRISGAQQQLEAAAADERRDAAEMALDGSE